jgi:hypothetical protein
MNVDDLQDAVDRLAQVSAQRFVLTSVAVVAVTAASLVTSGASDGLNGGMAVIVTVLALIAVVRPDSHAGSVTVAVVVLQWLATVDDTTSPLAIAVALLLLVFHTSTSLLAVTPISVTIDGAVLRRWSARTAVVAAATCWAWLTVVAFAERDAPGNVALTGAALVTLAALSLVARLRARPADA